MIKEHKLQGRLSLRNFYVRRFFRIIPASSFYLLTLFILQSLHLLYVERASWVASLLFSKNFVDDHTHYLSHFWSLSVEEQFYFGWPAIFMVLFSRGNRWALGTLAVLTPLTFIAGHIAKPLNGFSGMAVGCVLAFVYCEPSFRIKLRALMSTLVWHLCVLAIVAGIFHKIPLTSWWLPVIIPLVIVGTVVRPSAWAGSLLEQRWMRWLGRCSYSIYLWQELFCVIAMPRHFGVLQTFPMNVFCTFAVAIPVFYFLEKPMIRLGHRYGPPITPGRGDLELDSKQA